VSRERGVKRVLDRTVGRVLEAALQRVESTVTLEDQMACCSRWQTALGGASATALGPACDPLVRAVLLEAARSTQSAGASPTGDELLQGAVAATTTEAIARTIRALGNLAVPDPERLAGRNLFGLAALLGESAARGLGSGEEPTQRDDPASFDWDTDAGAAVLLREEAPILAGALRAGWAKVDAAGPRLDNWTRVRPARWFLKKGGVLGCGDLLRALLARTRDGAPGPEDAYTRDVCDRLLRHLEVKRDDWLPFRAPLPAAKAERERITFTHALLDAFEIYEDARYLNAALKANEWHSARLASPTPNASADDLMCALGYVASVARQEVAMAALRAR
jgi:hypothetical protein